MCVWAQCPYLQALWHNVWKGVLKNLRY
jgi:hypothetical protein